MPSSKGAPDPQRRAFGQRLIQLRKRAKFTQAELADHIQMSHRHLQSLEAGDFWPTLPTLQRLREVLKVSWETLCPDNFQED
jgi:transcriptional regulator with XRE-family HTH domain